MARRSSKTSAQDEVVALRRQLEEAQDALRAIRFGEVDALVIETGKAPQVFTLETADRPYRLFVEWMQQGAVTVRQNGRISYCNRSFSDLVGCPHERVVGSPFSAFVAPEGQDVLTALLDHALSSGSQGEVLLQAVDGAIIPAYITINSLPIGDVPARCIIVTDLSDQKRFQALSVNERLSRTILEQAVDAVIVCDPSGTIIRASQTAHILCQANPLSQAFEKMFPLIVGDAGTIAFAHPERPRSAISLAPVLNGQTVSGVEVCWPRDGRSLAHFLLNAGPLLDSDRAIIGCVVTLTDITAQKEAERQLREKRDQLVHVAKLASLGELSTGIAHELNNPLNNIALFVGNVLDQLPEHETRSRGSLQAALQQVGKAATIVSHMRTFGRAASSPLVPVSLHTVLRSAFSLMETQLTLGNVEVVMDFAAGDPLVLGNAIHLEQVFINLLSNARDAMEGSARKHLAVRSAIRRGQIEIAFCDSGSGIPVEQQSRVFDPFFTTKEVGKGTGLGLSISYGILKDHGGQIVVNSELGKGTTFTIRLPIAGGSLES